MKKRYPVLLLVFFCLVLVISFRNSFLSFAIKNSFKKIFPTGAVSLKSAHVTPFSFVVRQLEIQGGPGAPADFDLKKIDIDLKLSFFRSFFDKFFGINNGRISCEAAACAGIDFKGLLLLISRDDFFKSMDFLGTLENVSFQKIKAKDASLKGRLWRDRALISNISIDVFGGHVQGSGDVLFNKAGWVLSLALVFQDVDIAELMKALGAEERLKLTGLYTGPVRLVVSNAHIKELTGDLDSRGKGEMIIKDTSLLGLNAIQKDAANIVVENLKNYYYDIGNIKIRNMGQDIRIDISLKGQTGERNLGVVWHGSFSSSR